MLKLRPVLLLTGAVGPASEVLVAYISSVVPATLLDTDLLLDPSTTEHASTRLKQVSVVRLHKLATIHTTSLARRLGQIEPKVHAQIHEKLKSLLNL